MDLAQLLCYCRLNSIILDITLHTVWGLLPVQSFLLLPDLALVKAPASYSGFW